jgi:hypothetical protein
MLFALACGDPPAPEVALTRAAPMPTEPAVPSGSAVPSDLERLRARVEQFAVADLQADLSRLSDRDRRALDELVAAARLMDPIFDRQAWAGNPELAGALEAAAGDELGRLRLEYFRIMRGPWDRQNDHAPFATDRPRPPGAGYYPDDLTREAFDAYVAAHPDEKAALESPTSVVRRSGDALQAIPYHEAYAEWLGPAAQHLERAAELTGDARLRKFLRARARAFRTDDYRPSEKAWIDVDGAIEITIGPYETYEDGLAGRKTAFEAFVTVADPAASERLAVFESYLPDMARNLPIPEEARVARGDESPIHVTDLVFGSGDARTSVQTMAFTLPNDERIRAEKGAKKVLLRNVIQTKFDRIMRPIGERLVAADQRRYLSSEAFFELVLFHELSHGLGPAFVVRDGEKIEVRDALGASHSALEEAKADVMGVWNALYMISRSVLPRGRREELLVSHFAGLLRSVRFGVAEAHGQAAALQLGRLLEAGAAMFDERSGAFVIHFDRFEETLTLLLADICVLQQAGDRAAVEALLAREGVISPTIAQAVARLDGIPVDLRPRFPLAEPTPP